MAILSPMVSFLVNPSKLPASKSMRRLTLFATLSVGLLFTYLFIVFFFHDTILGVRIRLRHLPFIIPAIFGGTYWFVQSIDRRYVISTTRLKGISVASITVLLSMVAADIGYALYLNLSNLGISQIEYRSFTDQHILTPEAIPRRYYATEKNFMIHKPNMTIVYDGYGDLYYPNLMASPTVAKSVLERRHISYSIDEDGFRDSTPLEKAHFLALGDSFTFGVGVSQNMTWVSLLEQALGQPIYNMGLSGNGPKRQLQTLEYMLRTKPDSLKIQHLLWMIFEGNDLEDVNDNSRAVQMRKKGRFQRMAKGTIIEVLGDIPVIIKEQSIINQLMSGRVVLVHPFSPINGVDAYTVDGIRLTYPLYHSSQYGYRLFEPTYVKRSQHSESYVLSHPNRSLLDRTFEDMASLSRQYGFKVTILIAPSAPRLYGPYFENFPPISEQPYFINYVEQLSHGLGFDVINLYQLMEPYAREELLYWRDGTHWNERGNQVVAEIIAKHFVIDKPKANQSPYEASH